MAGQNDMATSSANFDPYASWARLSERVENQGKDIVDLRSNMNTGFQSVNANISALSNELRSNSKTPWPVIWSAAGVCSAILFTGGTFVYGTLAGNLNELKMDVRGQGLDLRSALNERITRQEMDQRTARAAEDRTRTESAISDLRKDLVPRAEHAREWAGADQRFADQQRQIDELKQAQGSVYGTRDFILELRARQDRIEQRLLKEPPL